MSGVATRRRTEETTHKEAPMAESIPSSLPSLNRPVRVQISSTVASKLDLFQKAQEKILERLGCPACCSGHDIRWDTVRDFLVDDNFKIREFGGGGFDNLG